MLMTDTVECKAYATATGQLLFVTKTPETLEAVKSFVLKQDQTDFFEVEGTKYFPRGRKAPLTPIEERKSLLEKLNRNEL